MYIKCTLFLRLKSPGYKLLFLLFNDFNVYVHLQVSQDCGFWSSSYILTSQPLNHRNVEYRFVLVQQSGVLNLFQLPVIKKLVSKTFVHATSPHLGKLCKKAQNPEDNIRVFFLSLLIMTLTKQRTLTDKQFQVRPLAIFTNISVVYRGHQYYYSTFVYKFEYMYLHCQCQKTKADHPLISSTLLESITG